jgi:anti-sigma factor RsiW
MNRCKDIRARMTLYLDDELQGSERLDFENHLSNCEPCRSILDTERRFLEVIRQSRPLYRSSSELRARVESLLQTVEPTPLAPEHLRRNIGRSLRRLTYTGPRLPTLQQAAAAAAIAMLVFAGVWLTITKRREPTGPHPSEFALMAADTHLRHMRGQLPLEINSAAPQQISSWFHDKLPFSVQLPNYQELSGQKKLYELEGARLVGYKNDYAAYVAYQMSARPISLVITSDGVATPSGGEEIAAKGLKFHYDSINGLKVITWSDRGLTYALVSDLEERGQQSCVVCHHGTKDQDFIEPLKPKS